MSPRLLHTSSLPRGARFHGLEFNNQGEGHAELNDVDDCQDHDRQPRAALLRLQQLPLLCGQSHSPTRATPFGIEGDSIRVKDTINDLAAGRAWTPVPALSNRKSAASPQHTASPSPSDDKPWQTRLARLRYSQGKATEARDLFAPPLGWFTEGFDMADLKDATALLDEFG